MKRLSLSALSLGLLAAAPSHALFGVGVSYGMNSTNVAGEASVQTAALPAYLTGYAADKGIDAPMLVLTREKISGLQQVGAKVWVDIPLTDITIDASSNVAWGSYESGATMFDENGLPVLDVNTGLETDFPVWGIGKGETPYINLLNDLTVRYNLLSFPPVISLVKISAGGGVTLAYGTRTVGKDDVKDLFEGQAAVGLTQAQAEKELADKLSENLYTTKFGGHLDLNVTVKPPVFPMAVYADAKWYLNTATTKAADNFPWALSAGLAFAL